MDFSRYLIVQIDVELFHFFCWTPVQMFSSDSFRVAIEAWTMVVTRRLDVGQMFLNEMAATWEWAVRRGRGIFSQKFRCSNVWR